MIARPTFLIAVAMLVFGAAEGKARAAPPLIVDLSSPEIAITTGFSGAELLLFGAIEGAGDIVVAVRGPALREVVRAKARVAGIWVNRDSVGFDNVPAFYRVASTRPLDAIAPKQSLRENQIGIRQLTIVAEESGPHVARFYEGLLRNKVRAGLYGDGAGRVTIIGGRLFRTTVTFPANVPTGTYMIDIYLFRGGRVVGKTTRSLDVQKAGLEADIFNFAHRHAAWYGIIAIMVALMAGWLAGAIFRKA